MPTLSTDKHPMATKFTRWHLDSPQDAKKLRCLINEQWKYRSAYIDREGDMLLTPSRIPKKVIIDLAAQLGLVCLDDELSKFHNSETPDLENSPLLGVLDAARKAETTDFQPRIELFSHTNTPPCDSIRQHPPRPLD